MIAPARAAAYRVLRAVNSRRVDLPGALARVRAELPDARDRALAGEIATGTLRWQAAYDHVVSTFTRRPLARLDPEILDILRLTLFQLLHLDRVPASAAVHDAVELARAAGKRSAAPLVNAVLRRASRERARLALPPRDGATREAAVEYLAVALSHPRWLATRWFDRYGFDAAEAWCRFDNRAPPLCMRANRLRITRDGLATRLLDAGVRTETARYAPDALVAVEGNPLHTRLAGDGVLIVQDEASQLVALAAGALPGERVFDACASPGGKTVALAFDVREQGLIVAADVRARRVRLLAATIQSAGARRVRVVQADAARALPFGPVFDRVLVDAPCSGLGTVRRDPDIKWRRTEDDLQRLAAVQLRLVNEAATTVRPGGTLVYATCSSEPEENEQVVEQFLERCPGFRAGRVHLPGAAELVDDRGHLRTYPFRHGLEAFFAARLVKGSEIR